MFLMSRQFCTKFKSRELYCIAHLIYGLVNINIGLELIHNGYAFNSEKKNTSHCELLTS